MDVYFSFKQGFKVAVQSHKKIPFYLALREFILRLTDVTSSQSSAGTHPANILNDPGPTFLARDPRSTTD